MMDVQLYRDILRDLSAIGGLHENDKFYTCLARKYHNVTEETLRSIIALWNQREVTRISHEIKDIDIYSWYKKLRESGNVSACQEISRQVNYPAALIAKIVLTGYAAQVMKEKKPRTRAREAKSLRKSMNSSCNKSENQTPRDARTVVARNVCTIKKHDDPRVELALNLFDEHDDIGKYFLDKFKFTRDRSNRNCAGESVDKASGTEGNEETSNGDTSSPCADGSVDSPSSDTDDTDTDSYDSSEEGEYYSVKELLENTNLIDDPLLAVDVFMCNMSDDQYGPTSDLIANSSGQTYERLLEERVKQTGLSYKTENKLRGVGVDKTPDIILSVPVAVDGFVINWIESKALFADYKLHQEFKKNQFKNYINRFGPGLVIYWHGFVDDLPELYLVNKQILVRDKFPENESFTFMSANKFKTWMQSANEENSND